MNHLNHIEEIAPRAAEIYGQDYAKLDGPTRQYYLDTIKATTRSGGQTVFEKACGLAIEEFYTGVLTADAYSKEAEEVEPEEEEPPPPKKPKKAK